MSPPCKKVVEDLILDRLETLDGCVVLMRDFVDIAENSVLSFALESLVEAQKLAQIGDMVFAKVRLNEITGDVMLDSEGGFDRVAKEALTRLGIEWELGSAEMAYLRGGGQIPAGCVVRILEGDPPKLSFKGYRLLIEREL